jgi:hypothetical protein
VGRGFVTRFPPAEAVPCFSPYSLFELRRRREVYQQFIEFFSIYPCVILKNEEQLFNDEIERYPNPSQVDPVLYGFSVVNKPKGCDLETLMNRLFSSSNVVAREAEWLRLKEEALKEMLGLKRNFAPCGQRYSSDDAKTFVFRAAIEQIACRAREWVRERLERRDTPDPNAFPSIKMALFTVFYRLYEPDRRAPETQDVFDILISTATPYVDALVVENFQAEIVRKVAKLDPFVSHVSVNTMRDLLRAAH